MFRLLLLSAIAAALSGCITTSPRVIDDTERAKLRAENKSVVLLHTSLHDGGCISGEVLLGQQDSSGRYTQIDRLSLHDGMREPKVPSQITLPTGDYGIVGLRCDHGGSSRTMYVARLVQRGNLIGGNGAIYERPIATFKVGVGEVVDIGSLRLPTRRGSGFLSNSQFVGVVTAIPEPRLANLAAANPALVQARVVRPMEAAFRM
jgi:hypothetical protein